MSLEYRVKGEAFGFDTLKCLRTDYYHNDCQKCLQICPQNAFFFDRSKLTVDLQQCTNCGVCLGVCPTEALSLEFFDPNDYIVGLGQEVELSCKKDLPCLSVFDVQHFARILLQSQSAACDFSHCEECSLNPEGKTLASIKERMREAEEFVQALGIEKRFEEFSYEPDRRGFFKSIFKATKELTQDESTSELHTPLNRIPVKNTLLKNAIKQHYKELQNTTLPTTFSFLANKRIEQSCNNCGECVQFCPTDALFSAKEGTAIWFMAGKCIACGICNDVCEPKSIVNESEIDIVEWAFDRGKELIEHHIEICTECKTPFSYKGGELICDRCKSFVEDFGDIFKLASEE